MIFVFCVLSHLLLLLFIIISHILCFYLFVSVGFSIQLAILLAVFVVILYLPFVSHPFFLLSILFGVDISFFTSTVGSIASQFLVLNC